MVFSQIKMVRVITRVEKYADFTSLGKVLPRQVRIVGNNFVTRVLRVMKSEAIKIYKEKRQKREMPSQIIDSIQYEIGASNAFTVTGAVFADSPRAIYLEEDRRLRNGKLWSSVNPDAPYKFMETGFNKGVEESERILFEEIAKIFGMR